MQKNTKKDLLAHRKEKKIVTFEQFSKFMARSTHESISKEKTNQIFVFSHAKSPRSSGIAFRCGRAVSHNVQDACQMYNTNVYQTTQKYLLHSVSVWSSGAMPDYLRGASTLSNDNTLFYGSPHSSHICFVNSVLIWIDSEWAMAVSCK